MWTKKLLCISCAFFSENNKWSTGQVSCPDPTPWSLRTRLPLVLKRFLQCLHPFMLIYDIVYVRSLFWGCNWSYNYLDWTQVFNIFALIYSTTKHKNNRRTSKNAHVHSMQATALLANTVMLIHPAYNTHCSLQIGGILSITWSILPTRIHSPQQHWYINQTLAQCLTL